jgi:hypothetical protein
MPNHIPHAAIQSVPAVQMRGKTGRQFHVRLALVGFFFAFT